MATLRIDPAPKHRISPYLYMQFMEPLGVFDSSVDVAWDFVEGDWQPKVIEAVRDLAPTMIRFGGCFASYYRWKEGVGPSRVPMINYCWDGFYANQVGTHEFMDFCRRVNAEPLMVVNMESDGRMHWAHPKNGTDRFGTAGEAAEWVRYCNDPNDPLRLSHGRSEPYGLKYWQIGNETSYDARGYGSDKGVEVTKRFIDSMRAADPSIRLIGWADEGSGDGTWCRKMASVDGLDMLAFHHHFDSGLPDSPLFGTEYRRDPERTWEHLMHAHVSMQEHIDRMRADCAGKRLAMTEGHFALPGRNRCEVLSSWGAGVAYARCHNTLMRNSDILDIATLADFCGNVWQVNALMIPTPVRSNTPYLQPVGAVMRLFGRHQGEQALSLSAPEGVDIVASRTGKTIFLHAANTDMHAPASLKLEIPGEQIASVCAEYIEADPTEEITPVNTSVFAPKTAIFPGDTVSLPAACVAAIEITLK